MFHKAITIMGAVLAFGLAQPGNAKETLFLLSVNPGSPHHVFHTRLATMASKYSEFDIQVSVGVAPPKGLLELAAGDMDFSFGAPTITSFMANQAAMYRDVAQAPELYEKLRTVMNYDGGYYTMVTFADSGITSLKDIKGKTVSLSIPGQAANLVLIEMIRAETGYEPGEDYTMSPLAGAAAVQAFQDGHIDMWAEPGAQPNPVVQEFALTRKIRLIGLSEETVSDPALQKVISLPGRHVGELAADLYGKNQANTAPTVTLGTTTSLLTHAAADEEMVYAVTKLAWDHLDELWEGGDFMKYMINRDTVFFQVDAPLHPGALRYYREAGFDVPEDIIPPEAQ